MWLVKRRKRPACSLGQRSSRPGSSSASAAASPPHTLPSGTHAVLCWVCSREKNLGFRAMADFSEPVAEEIGVKRETDE